MGHLRVTPHQRAGYSAIDQQGQLCRKPLWIGYSQLCQQIAEPDAPPLLERHGHLFDLVRRFTEFGGTDRLPATMCEALSKSLTLRGFINSEFAEQHYAEFLSEVGAGIAEGRIHYHKDIVDGLDKAPEAFIGMLTGAISAS